MIFHISRTSIWDEETSPHHRAFRHKTFCVDERTIDDPKKLPSKLGREKWWYAEGTNHRVENGHIMRDFHAEVWAIEIKDLEDLLSFAAVEGPVIVSKSTSQFKDSPSIEIYDGYRE